MNFEKESIAILYDALAVLEKGFEDLPAYEIFYDKNHLKEILHMVAEKMQDNFPYQHPLYAGQMLKPPHPVSRLAYMLAVWINPNNHALDGGRASSFMEKEAVSEIALMFEWEEHLGHLCSGGTMANLEALWVSGCLTNQKKIVASQLAHYTHQRLCDVLKLPFQSIPCTENAGMDLNALETNLKKDNIGTVVVTIGTTGAGSLDPLPDILELQKKYKFRIHADAAYGGYFILIDELGEKTRSIFDRLKEVDSIVVDPHKHGLQPYGCGCVLFKDTNVGKLYRHDSPYTYFSSADLHLGEISLECSRPGASAVALWATQKYFPLIRGGKFAKDLQKCRLAALKLFDKINQSNRFKAVFNPELDIVNFYPWADRCSKISDLSQNLYHKAAKQNLHLALVKYPIHFFTTVGNQIPKDQDEITCLRSCLMKPEHLDWIETIWNILDQL